MPSHYLILCQTFSCFQSFPESGSFPMSQLFASGRQKIGASASASALPVNIQDWFPLGLTGLISLLSKGLSRVLSSTMIWKHQFLALSLFFLVQLSISTHDYWKYILLWDKFVYGDLSLIQGCINLAALETAAQCSGTTSFCHGNSHVETHVPGSSLRFPHS